MKLYWIIVVCFGKFIPMPNLSFQILDDVLRAIEANTEDKPTDLEILIKMQFQGLSHRDVKVITDKLLSEKMIDCVIPNKNIDGMDEQEFRKGKEYHFITFDGLMLLQENGYVGRITRQNDGNKRVAALEDNQTANANRLTYLTAILAFGTLLPVGIEGVKMGRSHLKGGMGWVFSIQLMTFLFVALLALTAGIALGVVLSLTIKHLLKRR